MLRRLFKPLTMRAVLPFMRRAISGMCAKSRVRSDGACFCQYMPSHSDLIRAISTFEGHSVLHPLH